MHQWDSSVDGNYEAWATVAHMTCRRVWQVLSAWRVLNDSFAVNKPNPSRDKCNVYGRKLCKKPKEARTQFLRRRITLTANWSLADTPLDLDEPALLSFLVHHAEIKINDYSDSYDPDTNVIFIFSSDTMIPTMIPSSADLIRARYLTLAYTETRR